MLVRVRLRFQSTPLHYAQKCWFTFNREQCRLVGDVAYLISSQFGFKNGLQLFMEDFLVPTNEKADVFHDSDLIEVKCGSVNNGVAVSSSISSSASPSSSDCSDSSIPEARPPAKKRIKKIKKKAPPKMEAIKKTSPAVPTKKIIGKELNKPSAIKSKPLDLVKKLHVSEKKTASGGVHLTFNSTDSSSSEDERPTRSIETSKPVSPVKPVKPPVKSVEQPVSTRGGKQGKGKGKGRGGRQRRSFPSSIVIGGPDDIHTTHSTVYTNTGGEQASANKSSFSENGEMSTNQTPTGWDVPPAEDTPVISEPTTKDYSNCPDLDGAPRVGDQLAFKLLELSGSCTPEVSQYKLASVVAYNSTAKTVIVRYQGPSNTITDNVSSELAQFALEQEAMMKLECPEVVLELASLITPKLVTA